MHAADLHGDKWRCVFLLADHSTPQTVEIWDLSRLVSTSSEEAEEGAGEEKYQKNKKNWSKMWQMKQQLTVTASVQQVLIINKPFCFPKDRFTVTRQVFYNFTVSQKKEKKKKTWKFDLLHTK